MYFNICRSKKEFSIGFEIQDLYDLEFNHINMHMQLIYKTLMISLKLTRAKRKQTLNFIPAIKKVIDFAPQN